MAGKSNTLQDTLKRILDNQPQMEVTKLPAEEPKPGKNGFPMNAEWPKTLYIDDKKFPWLARCKAGEEVTLLVKAKVDDFTTHDSSKAEKDEPKVSAVLTLVEIGKWGAQ